MLRGLEARFVNFYVLPARVLDALLDSVVGTMPVQCRHTTSQGSTEKRGALWIRTRYAIRFVPSFSSPSSQVLGQMEIPSRTFDPELPRSTFPFLKTPRSCEINGHSIRASSLEKHVYLKISTLDTIEVKTKNFKMKKKRIHRSKNSIILNLSTYTYEGGNEGLIGEIYGIQG